MDQTRKVPRVSKFRGKSSVRGSANIEGSISPRKIMTKEGIKNVDIKTANALLEAGSVIDIGKGFFMDVNLAASAAAGEVGDEFRYSDIGIDEVGAGIGKSFGDSGQIGLKGTYRPGRGGSEDDYAIGLGGSWKFNKGGEVRMHRQMEMFETGGLKDQGGTIDPVSGNDVPSGSLKEEVRDDIDAKLSEGEFVFPADVVRFIGLSSLMKMRDKAKAGLQRMEEMGQMGNSDEATLGDDVPFEPSDLMIVAGPMPEGGGGMGEADPKQDMYRGGMPIRANTGTLVPTYGPSDAPTYSNTGRGDQLLGSNLRQYFNPETQEIRSVLVARNNLTGTLDPVSPVEEGFIPDTPANRSKPTQLQDTSARVDSSKVDSQRPESGVAGGPDKGDKGFDQMSPNEIADYGDFLGTTAGQIMDKGFQFATGASSALMTPTGSSIISGALGLPPFGFGVKSDSDYAKGVAAMRSSTALEDKQAFNDLVEAYDRSISNSLTEANVSIASVHGQKAADKATSIRGVSPVMALQHAEAVGRGNAPPGSEPNAFGGYSTESYGTNSDGDTLSGGSKDVADRAKSLGVDLQTISSPTDIQNSALGFSSANKNLHRDMDNYEKKGTAPKGSKPPSAPVPSLSEIEKEESMFGGRTGPTSEPGALGTSPVGGRGVDAPGSGVGQGPAGGNQGTGGATGGGAASQESEYNIGGLVSKPKRKKQNKKMKRGGLASRK